MGAISVLFYRLRQFLIAVTDAEHRRPGSSVVHDLGFRRDFSTVCSQVAGSNKRLVYGMSRSLRFQAGPRPVSPATDAFWVVAGDGTKYAKPT